MLLMLTVIVLLQAETDFYVFSELLKDYIGLIQSVKVLAALLSVISIVTMVIVENHVYKLQPGY